MYLTEGSVHMQYALLTVAAVLVATGARRVRLLMSVGLIKRAHRLYRIMACSIGLLALLAMAAQMLMLWLCGLLSWRSALPLHLCSAMGLLTLPMLVLEKRWLWHIALYAGTPGALLALVFPAVQRVPWMSAMLLAFYTLHAAVALAPLLPLAMGERPDPLGTLNAAAFLCVLALCALLVNRVTGGNYLFLELPVPGTPLAALASHGLSAYRLSLAAIACACLALEGLCAYAASRIRQRR